MRVVVDGALHPAGGGLVGEPGREVQGHVDASRDSGGHDQVAVLDPSALVVRRAQVLEEPGVEPVGRGVAPLQQADRAEDQ